jgi:molybdopterin-guanine dinucleotide biosynthesis protein MobB
MPDLEQVPMLGFAAYSGTGKTTLLRRLIPILTHRGLRIGAIKHAHHDFDIDYPGKDSYELRKAGAGQVLIASQQRWALVVERPEATTEPALAELLARLDQAVLDLVVVEGFRHEAFPKIELHRPALGRPLLYPADASILAIAHDGRLEPRPPIPQLPLNVPEAIADFIIGRCLRTGAAADAGLSR